MYPLTGQSFWLALAYVGFMINLFNLIPFHPLDGGRMASAISLKMWIIGVPLILVAAFKFFNPIILIFFIMWIPQIYQRWKTRDNDYYEVPSATRAVFASIYFGLIIILGTGMVYVNNLHGTQL